ncbi:MAG: RIP metalloprotease RseP [Sphingobacteriales bacterium JAD_PAG50586_3]|nr:MAG: RIP metalloprotease RseP [Sphingobacteriales bacterium JAD_PAG50586_3]
MDTFIRVSQFLLSLSILIALHEWGHYITAKKTGMRVNKFYLFFDFLFPFANVANFALFKKKVGDTEYGLGWFPFGGYVQIAGMVDETTSEEDLSKEPEPYEFRAKPAWARLLVMAGGVTVNLILGVLIFWMVLFIYGREHVPLTSLSNGVIVSDTALTKLGFADGDKIIGMVGADNIRSLEDINRELLLDNGGSVVIERNGVKQTIVIPHGATEALLHNDKKSYFIPAFPADVYLIEKGSVAEKMGIRKFDRILSINDEKIIAFPQIAMIVPKYADKDVTVNVRHIDGKIETLKGKLNEEGRLGVGPGQYDYYFKFEKEEFGFFEAFPAAIVTGKNIITNYVRQFKILFTKEGAKQIGGFAAMAKGFGSEWNWQHFWSFTAVLSFILAFMNILPIPMLDGGYILFLLIEVVIRRKIPEKVIGYANMVGLVLILGLLLFANGNDIYKAFIK